MATERTRTPEELRRRLIERICADPVFAEQLVADPARALDRDDSAVRLRAAAEDAEVQGYLFRIGPRTCADYTHCD